MADKVDWKVVQRLTRAESEIERNARDIASLRERVRICDNHIDRLMAMINKLLNHLAETPR